MWPLAVIASFSSVALSPPLHGSSAPSHHLSRHCTCSSHRISPAPLALSNPSSASPFPSCPFAFSFVAFLSVLPLFSMTLCPLGSTLMGLNFGTLLCGGDAKPLPGRQGGGVAGKQLPASGLSSRQGRSLELRVT